MCLIEGCMALYIGKQLHLGTSCQEQPSDIMWEEYMHLLIWSNTYILERLWCIQLNEDEFMCT